MVMVAFNRQELKALIRRRRAIGADRFDEVWNGVYVMAPAANTEHFDLTGELSFVVKSAIPDRKAVRVHSGANVSDRQEKWTKNYRVPDLAVFLPGNPAQDMGPYWFGGPDFAVEVISPDDRSRKKLEFYAKVGVRELLLVDRKPWSLELYRLTDGELMLVGKLAPGSSEILASEVLPISFRLLPGEPRPTIEVTQTEDARTWLI